MRPPFLKEGDTVRIISTARKITPEEVEPAKRIISDMGFRVELGDNLFQEKNQFAGTAYQRAEDLQAALDDPEVRAIFCARGGYGTVHVIDRVDLSNFQKDPKWIVGYSDITVLHCHIHQHFHIPTIHGSMVVNFPTNTQEALGSLKDALTGELDGYSFSGGTDFDREGSAQGEIIGGNLSILYSLTGTDSMADTNGKILFIEDLDEYLYHVDRMMFNLKKSNTLDGLEGVLVGGLTDMNDNENPYGSTAKEIVHGMLDGLGVPMAFDLPFGHLKDNKALYFGMDSSLEIDSGGTSIRFHIQ